MHKLFPIGPGVQAALLSRQTGVTDAIRAVDAIGDRVLDHKVDENAYNGCRVTTLLRIWPRRPERTVDPRGHEDVVDQPLLDPRGALGARTGDRATAELRCALARGLCGVRGPHHAVDEIGVRHADNVLGDD